MKVTKDDIENKLECWDIDKNGTIDFREVSISLGNTFYRIVFRFLYFGFAEMSLGNFSFHSALGLSSLVSQHKG